MVCQPGQVKTNAGMQCGAQHSGLVHGIEVQESGSWYSSLIFKDCVLGAPVTMHQAPT